MRSKSSNPAIDNFPFLLNLLDDESPTVKRAVTRELASYGAHLGNLIHRSGHWVDQDQQEHIAVLMRDYYWESLQKEWEKIGEIALDSKQLERGFALIAWFVEGYDSSNYLNKAYDELIQKYSAKYSEASPETLAQYLFQEEGFRGGYSNDEKPWSNSLPSVIREKTGNSLILSVLYTILGKRLGLDIQGCLFPGQFMARFFRDGQWMLVDCYHQGRILSSDDWKDKQDTALMHKMVRQSVPVFKMLHRCLNQLLRTYRHFDDQKSVDRVRSFIHVLQPGSILDKKAR